MIITYNEVLKLKLNKNRLTKTTRNINLKYKKVKLILKKNHKITLTFSKTSNQKLFKKIQTSIQT